MLLKERRDMFSTKHIIILVVSAALIVGLVMLTHKWDFRKQCKAMLLVGILSELVKVFYYIIRNEAEYGGILPKSDLPFHLCSIQILFVIYLLFAKNEKIKRAIVSFMLPSCLIGGLAAILIPTSTALNSWVITFQYFIYHIAIMVLAINLIVSKEKKFTITDYMYCLIFLLVLMFASIYINSILYDGTQTVNFMYVVGPPQEGLPILNKDHGWFVYIVHYATVILTCVTLCYLKPIIEYFKELKGKKSKIDKGQDQEQIEQGQ